MWIFQGELLVCSYYFDALTVLFCQAISGLIALSDVMPDELKEKRLLR